MSRVPMTLRLATAMAWSGVTRDAAIWSRLPSAAVAWATMSIWDSPIEFNHDCHGARISGRSALMLGIWSANWTIELARAPAARTRMTTRRPTTAL